MDHIKINDDFRKGLQSLRDVADALPEMLKRFPELPQRNSELFRVKDDSFLAVTTGDLVITLEPTERLMEVIAAARAWKAERGSGEECTKIGEVR